jgi:hypothetical protein
MKTGIRKQGSDVVRASSEEESRWNWRGGKVEECVAEEVAFEWALKAAMVSRSESMDGLPGNKVQ